MRRRSASSGACSGRSTAIGCGSKVAATTLSPSPVGELARAAHHVLVAEVDAVEVADDHHGAAEVGRHLVEGTPESHGAKPYWRGVRRRPRPPGRGRRTARRAPGTPRPGRTAPPARHAEIDVEPAADPDVRGLRPRRARRAGKPARAASAIGRIARSSASSSRVWAASSPNGPTAVRRSAVRWPPDAQTFAQVTGDRPDVGAAGAAHGRRRRRGSVRGAVHLDPVDPHAPRRQLDVLPRADPLVGAARRRP